MKIGYMTNAFGPLVGTAAGVTSVKDIGYLTVCDDEAALRAITDVGFRYIEVLEGNLMKYADNPAELKNMLSRYDAEIMSVCAGANYIYPDALEDEMAHFRTLSEFAAEMGVSYICLCGGAIRAKGTQEEDYKLLAQGLDMAKEVIESYGIKASYHPHLGSLAEHPDQIEKVFSQTSIDICPDLAHLQAGGSDPLEFIKKYYDRISFVHLKDLDEEGFAALGTGNVDIKAILDFLKEKGYEGDYLVEVDAWPKDPIAACKTSYAYLEGLLI